MVVGAEAYAPEALTGGGQPEWVLGRALAEQSAHLRLRQAPIAALVPLLNNHLSKPCQKLYYCKKNLNNCAVSLPSMSFQLQNKQLQLQLTANESSHATAIRGETSQGSMTYPSDRVLERQQVQLLTLRLAVLQRLVLGRVVDERQHAAHLGRHLARQPAD